MSLLLLQNIGMSFFRKGKFLEAEQEIEVLRNVNLAINEGQIVVLVGESGCGKTTIGKIITGLLRPTYGHIYFNGREVYSGKSIDGGKPSIVVDESLSKKEQRLQRKEAQKKRKAELDEFENSVQFVQQDSYAALNPARTIYQSLYAPIKNKFRDWSREQIDAKIEEIMGLVGLLPTDQFLTKYPHQLSGGQRQRILMARSVSLSPKLIVADEPVSMIDVSLRLSILDLMKRLNQQLGLAFVYITHDLSTARYIAENGKICIMYLGEIVEHGSIEEVVQSPSHPYTQALFSAVPVPDPVIARQEKPIKLKDADTISLIGRNKGCSFCHRCVYAHETCLDQSPAYHDVNGIQVKCDHLDEVDKWTSTN